jgi:hypothetical protein
MVLGQYFGKTIFFAGKLQILLVDFSKSVIQIFQYDDAIKQVSPISFAPTCQCGRLL